MGLVQWCQYYLEEYWVALVIHPKLPQILESNWSPPKDPLYKINVDGTIFPSQKEASVRVISGPEGTFYFRFKQENSHTFRCH